MIFTIIVTLLMSVWFITTATLVTVFWGDISKNIRIALYISAFPMFLGIVGFLFNSLKVLEQQQETPKYELIHEEVYRKIK